MKKYQCTLPTDIVNHIRGFSEPEHWYASRYMILTNTEYVQKRIKKLTPLNVGSNFSRRIFFRSLKEKTRFDNIIAKLDLEKRDQIFIDLLYNSIFNREIPANRHEGWHDHAVIYNNKGNLYYISHEFNREAVPFLYNTTEECVNDILVPLIKYDRAHRKRKRGICKSCDQDCPNELDECVNCVNRDKSMQAYKFFKNAEGEIVRWTW
jgi:hypothetical protein